MSRTVSLWANTIRYPGSAGHLWVYLNWALGLRWCGCEVIWLEAVDRNWAPGALRNALAYLKQVLQPYGFSETIALCLPPGHCLAEAVSDAAFDFERAATSDLLIDISYSDGGRERDAVRRFRRSALVDIDPGLTQLWIDGGQLSLARYDCYFTTGEMVGTAEASFPDCGLPWIYTPPCVAIESWPVRRAPAGAPYTTVSNWLGGEWVVHGEESYCNDKRIGFLPYLDLPSHVAAPLELALSLGDNSASERSYLQERGWSVQEAYEIVATPLDYQRYIAASRGEFSCVKPSCVRLQNAWISDRTLCYLASGKPAVVEHTGPSRFLPDAEGLLRFRTLKEAVARLEEAEADYDRHCRAARTLAEEHFDAAKVVRRVLEHCL